VKLVMMLDFLFYTLILYCIERRGIYARHFWDKFCKSIRVFHIFHAAFNDSSFVVENSRIRRSHDRNFLSESYVRLLHTLAFYAAYGTGIRPALL
jgi:hypothetical protein